MPHFHFHLRAHGAIHGDRQGTQLPNAAAAHTHAAAVAEELMLHSSHSQWSLRVENENGEAQFDLYFADVDQSLVPYPPQVRMTLSETCRRLGALTDALCAARQTQVESRMLMARARGRPQLVHARKEPTED